MPQRNPLLRLIGLIHRSHGGDVDHTRPETLTECLMILAQLNGYDD